MYYVFGSSICFSYQRVSKYNGDLDAVEIREDITLDELYGFYKANGVPVVVKGALRDEVAYREWSLDYLVEEYGDEEITMFWGNIEQKKTTGKETTIEEFVDMVYNYTRDPTSYDGNFPYWSEDPVFLQDNAEMLDDLEVLDVFEDPRVYSMSYLMWVGPAGTHTGLHIDTDPMSMLFQIYGIKEFTLYPPSESEYLYPSSKYDPGAVVSQVDHQHVDHEKFPNFKKATSISVILEAGDVIYVPSGWFHSVTSLTESISLSVRAETYCESSAYAFQEFVDYIHNLGLYKWGNCVCHYSN
eukprot:TRINITY_DN6658_c0_g1_i1.p1 TRINITY_DN6658_c0_g1~~TRINITY_DN6658_c0_g1_i1.p1  ORF type:complete len:299 (-),score=73.71 TRINITY_DN6658_c0_g1_i1:18-914(-)